MIKKICTFALIICMVFSVVPTYAAIKVEELLDDLTYMDDVYKYDIDLFEKTESIDAEAAAGQSRSVAAVVALGIMERNSEGNFLPNEYITLGDFASIVLKLISGSAAVTQEWYANYDPQELTTQSIAAKYIVGALGYSLYEKKYTNTAYPEMQVAAQLNLFRNLTQSPEAYITRLELAQMIYNALSVDLFKQTTFGPVAEYGVDEGATLLSEKFGALEISGTLTGTTGINLYSSVPVENERIVIDRAEYLLKNGMDYSHLLGKRVLAFVKKSDNSDLYEILGLMQHEQDESVEISLDKILSANNSEIVYEAEGKQKRVSVSKVETVLYNGSSMKNFLFTDELLDYEGSIVVGKSGKNSSYDIAVVYAMESYPVLRVTSLDKKVYFNNGMKFEGLEYIDLNDEDEDRHIAIIKDGKTASVSDIKAQDVISIAKSEDGNYVRVLVSSATASGTIAEITSDGVVVLDNGASYRIAKNYRDAYDEAMENGNTTRLKEIKLGAAGSFYISAGGRIADYVASGAPEYAFLKQMGAIGGSLEKVPTIRLFNAGQQWVNYELADKLTLDGEFVSRDKAYETMEDYRDIIVMQPVRYRISDEDKIVFLDTMIDAPEEKTDPERLCLSYVYNDSPIDWTLGFNLRPTNYSLSNSSVIFYLPTDKENEDKYKVIHSYDFVKNDTPKLSLYSASEFFAVPLAMFEGAVSQGSFTGVWIVAVNNILHSTNDEGQDVVVVKGLTQRSSNNNSYWGEAEFEITPEALENTPTLSKGDIFLYIQNADGAIDKIMMLIEDAALPNPDILHLPNVGLGADPDVHTGVVTGIDLPQKLVRIDVNTGTDDNPEINTVVIQSGDIAIYDSALKKYTPALLADLNIGDRVLTSGMVRKGITVAFR